MIKGLPLYTQHEECAVLISSGKLSEGMVSGEGLAPLEQLTGTVGGVSEMVWCVRDGVRQTVWCVRDGVVWCEKVGMMLGWWECIWQECGWRDTWCVYAPEGLIHTRATHAE